MAHEKTSLRWRCVTLAALIGLLAATAGSFAQSSSTATYSGQAYVVQATVPPLSPMVRGLRPGPVPMWIGTRPWRFGLLRRPFS